MSDDQTTPVEPIWTVVQQAAADDGLHLLRIMDVGEKFSFRNNCIPRRFSMLIMCRDNIEAGISRRAAARAKLRVVATSTNKAISTKVSHDCFIFGIVSSINGFFHAVKLKLH